MRLKYDLRADGEYDSEYIENAFYKLPAGCAHAKVQYFVSYFRTTGTYVNKIIWKLTYPVIDIVFKYDSGSQKLTLLKKPCSVAQELFESSEEDYIFGTKTLLLDEIYKLKVTYNWDKKWDEENLLTIKVFIDDQIFYATKSRSDECNNNINILQNAINSNHDNHRPEVFRYAKTWFKEITEMRLLSGTDEIFARTEKQICGTQDLLDQLYDNGNNWAEIGDYDFIYDANGTAACYVTPNNDPPKLICQKKFSQPSDCYCTQGYKLNSNGQCIACPAGTFGTVSRECVPCPIGLFTPSEGMIECTRASEEMFIDSGVGATEEVLCPAGFLCEGIGRGYINGWYPDPLGDNTYRGVGEASQSCPENSHFVTYELSSDPESNWLTRHELNYPSSEYFDVISMQFEGKYATTDVEQCPTNWADIHQNLNCRLTFARTKNPEGVAYDSYLFCFAYKEYDVFVVECIGNPASIFGQQLQTNGLLPLKKYLPGIDLQQWNMFTVLCHTDKFCHIDVQPIDNPGDASEPWIGMVNIMTAVSSDWTGCFFDTENYLRCYKTATSVNDCQCNHGYVRGQDEFCEPCPPGQYYNLGTGLCARCPFGQYSNVSPSFNCSRAQPGFWVGTGLGTIHPEVCPDGFLCPDVGHRIYQDTPVPCSDNNYCSADVETRCPAGSHFTTELHEGQFNETYEITSELADGDATYPRIPHEIPANMFSTSLWFSAFDDSVDYLPNLYDSDYLTISSDVDEKGRFLSVDVKSVNDFGLHSMKKYIPTVDIQNLRIRVLHKKDQFTMLFVSNTSLNENLWTTGPVGHYQNGKISFAVQSDFTNCFFVDDHIECHKTATAETDCNCGEGYYSEGGNGKFPCLQCPAGEYQDEIEQNYCIVCANGTTAPNLGSSSCDICESGFFCTKDGIGSYPCPVGTRQIIDEHNNYICVDCEPGTFNSIEGLSDQCTTCLTGHYCPSASPSPLPCLSMTYQDEPGAALCKPCEPGTITLQTGQTSCRPCESGFSCDAAGVSAPSPLSTWDLPDNRRSRLAYLFSLPGW
ncbi:Oidioi.mRNA.OKI2018_I69.chr2.g6102.t1.cds [Oikopleura dioica]|nr:Oidioi.mRNA.OKI2018_I69.chr2.g6102.t1.cds [Oikopleura dioica]